MEPNFWQKNLTVLEGPKSLKIVQERFLWFWQKSYSYVLFFFVYKITNETSNFLQTPHAWQPHALHQFLELWSQNALTNQQARFNQNPKVMPNSGSALSKEWVAIWNWFFCMLLGIHKSYKFIQPFQVSVFRHAQSSRCIETCAVAHTHMPAYVILCAHTPSHAEVGLASCNF